MADKTSECNGLDLLMDDLIGNTKSIIIYNDKNWKWFRYMKYNDGKRKFNNIEFKNYIFRNDTDRLVIDSVYKRYEEKELVCWC